MKSELKVHAVSAPFPVRTQNASGEVAGVHTEVTAMYFADKIVLTLAQNGKLAHWVQHNVAHRMLITSDFATGTRSSGIVGPQSGGSTTDGR